MDLEFLFCITCIKIVNFDICLVKSNLLTLELLYIVDVFLWVLMQGPKWPLFYSHVDPVWSV